MHFLYSSYILKVVLNSTFLTCYLFQIVLCVYTVSAVIAFFFSFLGWDETESTWSATISLVYRPRMKNDAHFAYSSTLVIEEISSREMSVVFQRTALHYTRIPEDRAFVDS
jgi:hypothetical protein